jgi:hypothetical protein
MSQRRHGPEARGIGARQLQPGVAEVKQPHGRSPRRRNARARHRHGLQRQHAAPR